MKFSYSETIVWLSLISLNICLCAEPISDYTGIDVWSIIYLGTGLLMLAVLILIYLLLLKFKSK